MSTLKEFQDRYDDACHAMQSGVAYTMAMKMNDETTPKHLRVGVNSAMVEHGALIDLLIKKGLMTELEYWEALATAMETEVRRYEQEAGPNIKFR